MDGEWIRGYCKQHGTPHDDFYSQSGWACSSCIIEALDKAHEEYSRSIGIPEYTLEEAIALHHQHGWLGERSPNGKYFWFKVVRIWEEASEEDKQRFKNNLFEVRQEAGFSKAERDAEDGWLRRAESFYDNDDT